MATESAQSAIGGIAAVKTTAGGSDRNDTYEGPQQPEPLDVDEPVVTTTMNAHSNVEIPTSVDIPIATDAVSQSNPEVAAAADADMTSTTDVPASTTDGPADVAKVTDITEAPPSSVESAARYEYNQ